MLDRKFVVDNTELIAENMLRRRSAPVDVEAFVGLESERRRAEGELQAVQGEIKRLSKTRPGPDAAETARKLRLRERELRDAAHQLRRDADLLLAAIPNLTHPDTPVGGEHDSREIGQGKTPRPEPDFPVRDHVEIGEDLGILDLEAGSRVAAPGFYFLQGEAVLLELALQRFALDRLMAEGFLPQIVPELAKDRILAGTGYTPRGNESNTYHIEGEDLNLIATSEIALCGRYIDSVLDLQDLPIKLCGISHCFRTERAHGRATRGLFRVHQFLKVEMVVLCTPDQSEAIHQDLLRIEREIFDELELPYRVVDIATGDLGAPAYRKYDLEAWMPGRGDGGAFSEVTSASNCTDYQARRLNIRYRDPQTGKKQFVHTLNGTGVAVGRAMIAILENNQQADGTVSVPVALRDLLGRDVLRASRV